MFDLQDNLAKLKKIFQDTSEMMLTTGPLNENIFDTVDQLSKDPKKDDIILSTLKIKENRNKEAKFSGEGCNLYHGDHKYENLYESRGLFAGVQMPDDSNKDKGLLNKDFLDIKPDKWNNEDLLSDPDGLYYSISF